MGRRARGRRLPVAEGARGGLGAEFDFREVYDDAAAAAQLPLSRARRRRDALRGAPVSKVPAPLLNAATPGAATCPLRAAQVQQALAPLERAAATLVSLNCADCGLAPCRTACRPSAASKSWTRRGTACTAGPRTSSNR